MVDRLLLWIQGFILSFWDPQAVNRILLDSTADDQRTLLPTANLLLRRRKEAVGVGWRVHEYLPEDLEVET